MRLVAVIGDHTWEDKDQSMLRAGVGLRSGDRHIAIIVMLVRLTYWDIGSAGYSKALMHLMTIMSKRGSFRPMPQSISCTTTQIGMKAYATWESISWSELLLSLSLQEIGQF